MNLHIIATGVATALGGYRAASIAAALAKVANIIEHPYMLDLRGQLYSVAMAPYIDTKLGIISRYNALLNYALSDIGRNLSDTTPALPRSTPLVLCLPSERRAFSYESMGIVAQQLIDDNPTLCLSPRDLVAQGHAALFFALTQVQAHLEQHEFCLLAGVDSYIDSHTLNEFDAQKMIKTADHPWGFIPGEGAACLAFCQQSVLDQYGLSSFGAVTAWANAHELVHHSDGVCTGQGLTEAISAVLQQLQPGQKISHTICDLNGQTHRTDEYGFMLTRLSHFFKNTDDFTTPADCWGDVGATSGLLHLALATEQEFCDPKDPILLFGSSFNALRGAALFKSMGVA